MYHLKYTMYGMVAVTCTQKLHCSTVGSRLKSINVLSHLPASVITAHHPHFLNYNLSLECFTVPNDIMMKTNGKD
jgi:hypothetical protein